MEIKTSIPGVLTVGNEIRKKSSESSPVPAVIGAGERICCGKIRWPQGHFMPLFWTLALKKRKLRASQTNWYLSAVGGVTRQLHHKPSRPDLKK